MDEQQPIVTILTPTYNHGKYLAECINSAINQQFRQWEMLILDDGSTDDTAIIAKEFEQKDPRIRYFRQDNIGINRLAETYNKGLAMAKGEFIAILEGDDYWEPMKLQIQVKYLLSHPDCVLSWGKAYSISSDRETNYGLYPSIDRPEAKYYNNEPVGSILNIFFLWDCIPALTIVIRKDVLLSIGGFKHLFDLPSVDVPVLFELAALGPFYFVPEALGSWRNYAAQITKTLTTQIMEGYVRISAHFFEAYSQRKNLHFDIQKTTITAYVARQRVIVYSRAGRYKLLRRDFKNARKDYKTSLLTGGFTQPMWKVRSLVGYFFSLLHLNVEGLSKTLGKKHYSTE